MNAFPSLVIASCLTIAGAAHAQDPAGDRSGPRDAGGREALTVTHHVSQPSSRGPDATFTGAVRIDPLFDAKAPSRVGGAYVTFEPGARTNWHTHPLGQVLVVTHGAGWTQQEGGERHEIRAGDVVRIPPGVRHWHGATATNGMTHIAIHESLDGSPVDWMEEVGDDEYGN